MQPGAALMLWGEKPTVPPDEIAAMRYARERLIYFPVLCSAMSWLLLLLLSLSAGILFPFSPVQPW